MPIQIKRQNPRGGAGGVAVKMTSPIRVLAQHACAHHGALSPQVLHIADPRARATIAETHSHRFRREDSLRDAAWSPRRLAELVCRRRR